MDTYLFENLKDEGWKTSGSVCLVQRGTKEYPSEVFLRIKLVVVERVPEGKYCEKESFAVKGESILN